MRLGVIGTGKIVAELLTVVPDLPDVEVTAIYGRSPARVAELTRSHPIGKGYSDFDQFLRDPNIDTVYVAVPNELHYEFARQALLADLHVVCEKPFTTSVAQLMELRRIAQNRGLILVEAITTQYLSNFAGVAARLPELGDVKLVQCQYSQRSSRYDAFKSGETPPAFDPAAGGGALMDINIYCVHFVVGLLGAPQSATYTANTERDVDTSGVLVLDYGTCTAVCVGAKDSAAPNRQIVQGDKGTLIMEGAPNTCGPYILARPGQDDVLFDDAVHPHRMYQEFVEFARMVRDRDLAARDRGLEHSIAVLQVISSVRP